MKYVCLLNNTICMLHCCKVYIICLCQSPSVKLLMQNSCLARSRYHSPVSRSSLQYCPSPFHSTKQCSPLVFHSHHRSLFLLLSNMSLFSFVLFHSRSISFYFGLILFLSQCPSLFLLLSCCIYMSVIMCV